MTFTLLTNSTASNRLRARRSSSLRSGGANTTRPKLIDTAYHKALYESRTYCTSEAALGRTEYPRSNERRAEHRGFRLANWDVARAVHLLPSDTPLEWK